MLKLRIASDLHLDSWFMTRRHVPDAPWMQAVLEDLIPPLATDSGTVLVIAGDLWEGLRPIAFGDSRYSVLGTLAARFKALVLVLGNHDCYGERVPRLYAKYAEAVAPWPNVHLLEAAIGLPSVVIDGYRFMGGTLWTDMHRGDPLALLKFDTEPGEDGRLRWNDRNYIRTSPSNHAFDSLAWLRLHRATTAALQTVLQQGAEPVVLVTHMAPLAPPAAQRRYALRAGDISDAFYISDLTSLFSTFPRIRLAVHGHLHSSLDYDPADDLRVVCNPRGYRTDQNPAYNPTLLVELP